MSMASRGVPPLDRLGAFDTVIVVGKLEQQDQAEELAGGLRLAVEEGLNLIVLYPVRMADPDLTLVSSLVPELEQLDDAMTILNVDSQSAAFYRYFGAYGRSITSFFTLPSSAAVLGAIGTKACAVEVPVGRGRVYVLPFQVADLSASYNPLIRAVLAAIEEYEAGMGEETVPEFARELRLPGEPEVLARIASLRGSLAEAEGEAERLRGYRQVIGYASGAALERMVIEVLNLVLAGTGYEAEDREDVKAEDFWLVEGGEDRSLAEVKGIGGSINRQAVNQVDNHRAERELSVEDLPGLLIVNPFRNSDELEQRARPVPEDVIRHAVRLNVLVLRTLDLYLLLHQTLDGKPHAATSLVDALAAGGGWLEVSESGCELRTA